MSYTVNNWKDKVPKVWCINGLGEPQNHYNNCYYCLVNIKGINKINRQKWSYSDLDSARRLVLHPEEIPIPSFSSLPELTEQVVGCKQEFNWKPTANLKHI